MLINDASQFWFRVNNVKKTANRMVKYNSRTNDNIEHTRKTIQAVNPGMFQWDK